MAQEAEDVRLGSTIRARRTELVRSSRELASAIGVSYEAVRKDEAGTNRVAAGRLPLIARALDVDIAYSFEPAGPV